MAEKAIIEITLCPISRVGAPQKYVKALVGCQMECQLVTFEAGIAKAALVNRKVLLKSLRENSAEPAAKWYEDNCSCEEFILDESHYKVVMQVKS